MYSEGEHAAQAPEPEHDYQEACPLSQLVGNVMLLAERRKKKSVRIEKN